MRDEANATLLVDGVDSLLYPAQAQDWLLEVEGDEVAFEGSNLSARNQVEAIAATRPELSGLEGDFEIVVLGDCDDVEVCLLLYVVEDGLYGIDAIAGVGVDV
jgi:hypothetical protein